MDPEGHFEDGEHGGHGGHNKHAGHSVAIFRDRFRLSLLLSIPVVLLSEIVQNLAWAAGYNVITIPLAAGILAPIGFSLPPAVGTLLMNLSTLVVGLTVQLLRRIDLQPT